MARSAIETAAAPPAQGPYSQAIRHGSTLYCAGQIGLVPGILATTVPGSVEDQATQALENLEAVCAAAGGSLRTAVKVHVLLADVADFAAVNGRYAAFFARWSADRAPLPARTTVAAGGLPLGAAVEIDAIVALDER